MKYQPEQKIGRRNHHHRNVTIELVACMKMLKFCPYHVNTNYPLATSYASQIERKICFPQGAFCYLRK